MGRVCYTTVSDIVLCQRCPALLAYSLHKGEKYAWTVGIKGNGSAYGSIFHKNIAQVFFEAASNPRNALHRKTAASIAGGTETLEAMVRENIFLPFVASSSEGLTAGQVMAMARGVTVWVHAMSEFFRCIPSLLRWPEGNMQTVFIPPEQKLQAGYSFHDGNSLMVTGCYDALMFNPDRAEARLFEFKGYMKSDIAVPLSQSLIYSWLIWKHTGIVPSVEIIYLDDEDRVPDVFSSESVMSMIKSGLPGLFFSAFNVIASREIPEILRDDKLCSVCKFRRKCKDDWGNAGMRRRRGASLLNVMVFMLFAVMVTAQVFFFTKTSMEEIVEEREIMSYRLMLDELVEVAENALSRNDIYTQNNITHSEDQKATYQEFFENTQALKKIPHAGLNDTWEKWEKPAEWNAIYNVSIHDLDYTFKNDNTKKWQNNDRENWSKLYSGKNMYKKVFAAVPPDTRTTQTLSSDGVSSVDVTEVVSRYYLVRARVDLPADKFYGRNLMYQVLVRRSDDVEIPTPPTPRKVETLSFQEVWY